MTSNLQNFNAARRDDAIKRWGNDAFVYPAEPHAPNMTAACRECGARCDRTSASHLCIACYRHSTSTTHCIRGHNNWRVSRHGSRYCRDCDAERNRRNRATKRAAT